MAIPKTLSSTFDLLRDLPRPARISLFIFFTAGLADGVLMPFFALWAQQEAGIPVEYIGLLLGCYAGGELLATPFVGGIADRVGRRPVLLISSAGVGTGFMLLYLTRGVVAAAFSLIVIGMFESVLHPTAATVIADVIPAQARRTHFALTRVLSNIGHTVGPAVGALLALWSLGLVFCGSGAALLLGALVVGLFLTETRTAQSHDEHSDDDDDDDDDEGLGALAAAFRDHRLAALLLPIAVLEIGASWIEAVTPLYAHNSGELTASQIGLLFTYAGALGALFQLPLTQASARMSGFAIILTGGLALTLAFACLTVSPAVPLLIAAVSLMALSEMLSGPVTQAIASELAPRNAQATYMAAFAVVGDLKDAAGPAIGTWLFAIAARLPWMVGMPIALAAAFALGFAAHRHERSA
jgi:MFS transporter, DHA1 family, tetracycline resistance protein